MKKQFIDKVIREGVVDAKNYRYCLVADIGRTYIKRLPISALNTTEALDGWEIVAEF